MPERKISDSLAAITSRSREGDIRMISSYSSADLSGRFLLCSLAALALAIYTGQQLKAQESTGTGQVKRFEKSIQAVGKIGERSIVAIAVSVASEEKIEASETFDALFNPASGQLPARVGIGVILQSNAETVTILTNAHLLEPITRAGNLASTAGIFVRFTSKETARAIVIASDPRSDLAVIQVPSEEIPTSIQRIESVKFPSNLNPQKGSILVAVGNPWMIARDGSANVGMSLISNIGRKQSPGTSHPLVEKSLHDLGTLLELDLFGMTPTSGTLLLNLDGEFTGIVTSIAVPDGHASESCFAIPMTPGIERIINDLRQGYEVEYGFLGISPETSLPEDFANLRLTIDQSTAVLITRVATNSPAEIAGLQREDMILRVNDLVVETSEGLVREVGLIAPGEDVELLIHRRDKGLRTVSVKLGKWPIYDDALIVTTNSRFPSWRGIEVDYPTGRRRYLRDRFLKEFPQGVVISKIINGSPADQAGLQVGQFITKVDDQSVATPTEFHHTVKDQTHEVQIVLVNGTEVSLSEPTSSTQQN